MKLKLTLKKTLLSLVISSSLISSAFAQNSALNTQSLSVEPNPHHVELLTIIDGIVSEHHFTPTKLTGAQAGIYLKYLVSELDKNKVYLTQSEFDSMMKLKSVVIDKDYFLMSLYKTYNVILNRNAEFLSKSITLLDSEGDLFNFTQDDKILKAKYITSYAETEEERSVRLKKKLKFQLLEEMLLGKPLAESKVTLSKRYTNQLKRISSLASEDVFQLLISYYLKTVEYHTDYLSPTGEDTFNESMHLKMEGIGAILTKEDDYIVIKSLISGGPAYKTKAIEISDRIISVKDGETQWFDVVGLSISQAVKKIKGKKGTNVYLKLLSKKDNYANPKIVKIERDEISLDQFRASHEVYSTDGTDIAVIRIPSFYQGVSVDVERSLNEINEKNISRVIVDLRNNGGGSLPEAVKVSGLFIEKGLVVQIKTANNEIKNLEDTDEKLVYGDKLMVLVNENSASASEIVASSLQDHKRAIIVGNRTFGKGTVQNHIPLEVLRSYIKADVEKLGGLKITVAKFYRPNGESTQLKGVIPDISFPNEYDHQTIGESSFDFVLENDKISNKLSSDLTDIVALKKLREGFDLRLSSIPYLKFIEADFFIKQKSISKKYVALNYEERIAKREKAKEFSLNKVNKYLIYKGQEPVSSLEDVKGVSIDLDYGLDEAMLMMTKW
jgi:carboxyl-terminal processing protease